MADNCCQGKTQALEKLKGRQKRVLWIVLGINAVMFFVEFGGGVRAQALSLTGDSLDMLGDTKRVWEQSLCAESRSQSTSEISFIERGNYVSLRDRGICASNLPAFCRGNT